SSHCSPGSTCASPHIGTGCCVHAPPVDGQVQPLVTAVQSDEQPWRPVVSPLSHASWPSTTPSPQMIVDVHACPGVGQTKCGSTWQVPEQPSPGIELPSSHCSGGWMMPSPQ